MKKKITIVTLTYNNWRLLETAILSVYSQELDDGYSIEYIIVDDGTVGFDFNYIKSILDNNALSSRCDIRYQLLVNPENLGTVRSFNRALSVSIGEVIIPLSADDCFISSYTVMNIIHHLNNSDEDVVTFGRDIYSIDMNSLIKKSDLFKYSALFINGNEWLLVNHICRHGNIISGASTCYKLNVFKHYGFFDENYRLLEDLPFYFKILTSGESIGLAPFSIIKYREGGVSDKKSINPMLKRDLTLAYSEIIKNDNINFFSRRAVKYRWKMTAREKLKLRNVIFYFDFFVCSVVAELKRRWK